MARAIMNNFVVVEHSEVPEGPAGRGGLSPASIVLLEGKTIFIEGERSRSARFARMAKPRGYRVRTRAAERSGKKGVYVWLEETASE